MEKNRISPVKSGKGYRMSYAKQKDVLEMPNFIEVQKNSYNWFLTDGLKEAFRDISPITDYSGQYSLEFVDFQFCKDDLKYSIEECKDHGEPQKILVYDLGGGTFDVSVIEIGDNLIEVLATAGDNHLGGDDFDARITEYLVSEFQRTERVDLRKDATAMQRVREEAEKAKKSFSYQRAKDRQE